MAKSSSAALDTPRVPRATPDDQDSRKTSELPANTSNANNKPAPRRSQSLNYGLASAPPVDASSGPSLVEQRAREHSGFINSAIEPCQSTEEFGSNETWPHGQTPRACRNRYDASLRKHLATSLINAECRAPTCATGVKIAKPVLGSSQRKLVDGHLPFVKVLLYGNKRDCYSAEDIKRFIEACLKCIPGVFPHNIRVHHGDRPVGEEFDWFFDPNDIAPGGLLILCISGHGQLSGCGVEIKMDRFGPKLMDTFDLHAAINKIQIPCTLEIILGTCNSEAVISGLDRLLVMEDSRTSQDVQCTLPPLSALMKSFFPREPVPWLAAQATIIVWAAAVDGGPAYPEADLPGKEGKNDVMIGAICRALGEYTVNQPQEVVKLNRMIESATQPISRRILFENIREAVIEYNSVRDEKYLKGTKADLDRARSNGKYCGPQLACLLSSPGSRELVLDSPAFTALGRLKP